ncbi:MAG TPA: RluA family pseudouridine synthase [Polyangiaceae bacterium]
MALADGEYLISAHSDGLPLDRAVRALFDQGSWSQVRNFIRTGKIRVNGEVVTDPGRRVRGGDRVAIRAAAPRARAPGALAPEALVYVDAHLVVAVKPAGMMSVPYEDERDTFADAVRRVLEKRADRALQPLGVVHRIDKETSGLLVFTRRASAKRNLEQQFRVHSVRRIYLALAHGQAPSRTLRSRIVRDRGDGVRGSTRHPTLGQLAVTHVKRLEELRGASLLECRLETGRTHQIRIHLAEAGHPLLGEKVYLRSYSGPLIAAPRLMLHAQTLGFEHPVTGQALDFSMDPPKDFQAALRELRP